MRIRKDNRLKCYDYSQTGYYFVTICTHNHKNYFGQIKNDKMILNTLGNLVEKYWREIPIHYPKVDLDELIIMPNHIHGIIIIDNDKHVGGANLASQSNRNAKFAFPTDDRSKMLLSKIIQQFKRVCTIEIRKLGLPHFSWQRSFYDRIIRNEQELFHIRKYISQNPLKLDIKKSVIQNIELCKN